jgi:hypothetical protein
MIPEVDKRNKIENSDIVCKRSDQSGSDEIPTMSATSTTTISWPCDISPQIVPCTGDCKVKIPLPVKDIPFSWLKVFLDDGLINLFTVETNRYAHQYLSTVGLSPHSQDHN